MTTLSRRARVSVLTIALLALPALTGCSVAENMVGGVVSEAQGQLDDAVSDALGGAGITTDGELPSGFPTEEIPLAGEVLGGGSAPEGAGWVVRTELAAGDDFATAQAALEDAGYESSAVNSDTDSGFGTFTLTPYTVVLTVATDADVMTATYVVTKA